VPKPLFVWCDRTGLGRNVFVLFRRRFTLAGDPARQVRQARLHLFADTRYRLWVNGEVVAYGPARFIPSHPEYDSVDLRPWLRKGRNALVAEANSFGESSFEAMPSVGGFIAWGKVRTTRGFVDLSTPGDWKMQPSDAWDADAPLYSFAQGPAEILDLRKLPEGVHGPGFNDRFWPAPVVVARQDAWGRPQPRSVPMLSMDLHSFEKVLVNAALAEDEQVVGCRTSSASFAGSHVQWRCCYGTNLFSPIEQDVTLGIFWGPHFLNGRSIEPVKNTALGSREDYPVRLRKGWNFLYGEPELVGGGQARRQWGILIALPKGKGLVASAAQDVNCPDTMVYCEGVPAEVLQAARPGRPPTAMEQLPRLDVPWRRARRGQPVPHPARVMAWDTPRPGAIEQPYTLTDIHIPPGQDWVVLLDFGREYLGHVVLDVDAPAGTVLDAAYDERLRADGLLGLYRCNPCIDNADRFIAAGGRRRIEAFRPRGGRYVQIAVRGAAAPVVLHSVEVRLTLCPAQVTGRFESSDPVLDWTWSAGVHTLLTCLEDVWNADAWRERGLYLGDTYVIHNAATTFWSDFSMIRRCLWLWADSQYPDGQIRDATPAWLNRPLIDYTLIFVLLLHDYVHQTADLELLRKMWPTVERIFDSPVWKEGPNGLWLGDEGEVFIDWTTTQEMKRGENGVLNAFRYAALQQAARLASLLHESRAASRYTAQARRVKRAFHALWNDRAGRFAAAMHEGKLSEVYSAHTNVLALLYGLAEGARAKAAMAYVGECLADENFLSPTHVELYFHKYVLEMLYQRGQVALAEHVMHRTWGMMKGGGAWALWEAMVRGLKNEGDLCIAWSSSPLIAMGRRILGVRPAPMRPREVLIAPTSATLSFARGAVAHPDGPIEVDWHICGAGKNRHLELTVKAPRKLKIRLAPEGPLADMPLRTGLSKR